MKDNRTETNKLLDEFNVMAQGFLQIPMPWFQNIQKNGKPYMSAILILADAVYWYKTKLVYENGNNQPVEMTKKFSHDYLQRYAKKYLELYGLTTKQVTEGKNLLQELGITKCWVEQKAVGEGSLSMPFIDLIADGLRAVSVFKTEAPPIPEASTPYPQGEGVSPLGRHTETTTKTTAKTGMNERNNKKRNPDWFEELRTLFYKQIGQKRSLRTDNFFEAWVKEQQLFWGRQDLDAVWDSVLRYLDNYTDAVFQHQCRLMLICQAVDVPVDIKAGDSRSVFALDACLQEFGVGLLDFGEWFLEHCSKFNLGPTVNTALNPRTLQEFQVHARGLFSKRLKKRRT